MERTIPGKRRFEGQEFCYLSDNGQEDFEVLWDMSICMLEFEKLNKESQIILLLSLSEVVLNKFERSDEKEILENAIKICWEWLLHKQIKAEQLYDLLENMDDTGIMNYMLLKSFDVNKKNYFFCIANALAYTTCRAYEYEGEKYLPQTIENTDDDTIKEFIKSFNDIYNITDIFHNLVTFLYEIGHLSLSDKIKKVELFLAQSIKAV